MNSHSIKGFFNFIPGGDTLSISLLYFISSAIVAFVISPFIIKILYILQITRQPKGDKASELFDKQNGKIGTPIMGGLIFIITILVITFLFNWERNYTWLPIGCLILAACIGGIDDLLNIFNKKQRNIPKPLKLHIRLAFVHKNIFKRIIYFITIPLAMFKRLTLVLGSKPNAGLMVHEKLILQSIIGIIVGLWIYYKIGWTYIWLPSILINQEWFMNLTSALGIKVLTEISSIYVGWLIVPIIMLTIILISNAVNISDGMDGLAGGLSFIAFSSYGIIAFGLSEYGRITNNEVIYNMRSIVYLCFTAAGALLAYLYFNAKPARVQMGDLGSLAIGTLISVIAVILNKELTLILIAGVFLINGIISRILQVISIKFFHKKIFNMIPLHYHFAIKGWPEEKVVTRFWVISVILSAIGIWLAGI